MKALGLVVEYNPFHYGHLYHLEKSKDLVKPDVTVAVMSGNFVQRGEPAIVEKFARAEAALKQGIDLVVELPVVYSLQDAGGFATGAIWTLDRIGVTDLVFGSETDDTELLKRVSKVLIEEPEYYRDLLKKHLKKGHSFPNARKYALRDFIHIEDGSLSHRIEEIGSSNNILGVEYLRAIDEIGSKIEPLSIKRVGSSYTEEQHRGKFSSATAIRKLIQKGDIESASQAIPKESFDIILREIRSGRGPVFKEDVESFFISFYRLLSRDDYNRYYGFVEGLDARFQECSLSGSLEEYLHCVKSKRFTLSRIRRLMYYPVFRFTDNLIRKSNEFGPQYIRVLGFNEKGRNHLSNIKHSMKIPIITTASLWRKVVDGALKKEMKIDADLLEAQLERDFAAVRFYASLFKYPESRSRCSDLLSRVIYNEEDS
ncbi:MAG: nucleotidyltransferase [Thermotogaceae bacterium]|nr:nucleotidyltransferase [Thermotogaceae bacterium]